MLNHYEAENHPSKMRLRTAQRASRKAILSAVRNPPRNDNALRAPWPWDWTERQIKENSTADAVIAIGRKMKPAIESIREGAVRAMRDRVFEKKTSDNNWDGSKDHWMKPENLTWLHDECARMDLKDEKP